MKQKPIDRIRDLIEIANEKHTPTPPVFNFTEQLSDLQRGLINNHLIWALAKLEEVEKWMDGKTVDKNLFQKWKKEVFGDEA